MVYECIIHNPIIVNLKYSLLVSGEVNVKFCSDAACDVTTVTITNLARTTISTETGHSGIQVIL